jgi:hypothetical protein
MQSFFIAVAPLNPPSESFLFRSERAKSEKEKTRERKRAKEKKREKKRKTAKKGQGDG